MGKKIITSLYEYVMTQPAPTKPAPAKPDEEKGKKKRNTPSS